MTAEDDVRAADRKRLVRVGALALLGAGLGAGLGYSGVELAPSLDLPDVVACAVAAGLFLAGGFAVLVSFNRRTLSAASMLDGEAQDCEIRAARRQGAVVILAGALMALPVVAAETRLIGGSVAYAAVLLIFGLQSVLNWSVWKRGDEMTRRMISEAGALSFWVMQGGLFLYAAAERLGLTPAATAWQITVVMMAGYLILSSVAALRRGYA